MPDTNKVATSNLATSFNTSANTYERRIGRATRAVAAYVVSEHILPTLPPSNPTSSISPTLKILDVACGTGAVVDELLLALNLPIAQSQLKMKIQAVDASPGMIDIMHEQIRAKNWATGPNANVEVGAQVMDGQELQFEDGVFDVAVMNFGIMFLEDAAKGVREMSRVLVKEKDGGGGGVVVVSCWRTLPVISLFATASALISPLHPYTHPTFLTAWSDPTLLNTAMTSAGFPNVQIHSHDVYLWGYDLLDLCGVLCANMKGFIGEDWSEEELGRLDGIMMEVLNREVRKGLGGHAGGVVEECVVDKATGRMGMGIKCAAWVGVARR